MTEVVVARKIADIRARIARVHTLRPATLEGFLSERTIAEALILNVYLALHACSDVALHGVADRGLGVPGDVRAAYALLARAGVLDTELARRLAGSVGLLNRIAHEYGELDLSRVYAAARGGVLERPRHDADRALICPSWVPRSGRTYPHLSAWDTIPRDGLGVAPYGRSRASRRVADCSRTVPDHRR